jgi:hypothetical protein
MIKKIPDQDIDIYEMFLNLKIHVGLKYNWCIKSGFAQYCVSWV